MWRSIATITYGLVLLIPTTNQDRPATRSADTQPSSRPADSGTTLRKPAQAEILRNLLGREDRPKPIRSQDPVVQAAPGVDAEGLPLILEGSLLSERPGRLIHENGRAKFAFHVDASTQAVRSMEILENQLLEAMEREADAGFTEFIITAEVTRYHDRNYLLLRKILRRVGHGNLAP